MARAASTAGGDSLEDIAIRRAGRADAGLAPDPTRDLARSLGTARTASSGAKDIEGEAVGARAACEAVRRERRGEAVGLCLFLDSLASRSARRGVRVQDLLAAESARGPGRRLLAAAIVRARGGESPCLSAGAGKASAQGFSERLGPHRPLRERIDQVRNREFIGLARGVKGTSA